MSFRLIDYLGNTLVFDSFRYQSETDESDKYDMNWLCCRIALNATIEQSVDGYFLTWELSELAKVLQAAVDEAPSDTEVEFEPLEPYINLAVSRGDQRVLITARLDLRPGLGPVIEYDFECEPAEIVATVRDIHRTMEHFPVRKIVVDK